MMASCSQINIPVADENDARIVACKAHQAEALAQASERQPDLILVSDLYTGVYQLDPPADPLTGGGSYRWALATAHLAAQLKQITDHVVFLASPSLRTEEVDCAVAGSTPADCVHTVNDVYREVIEGEAAAVTAMGAVYLTTEEWLCVDGQCPAFAGSTPTMRDEMGA